MILKEIEDEHCPWCGATYCEEVKKEGICCECGARVKSHLGTRNGELARAFLLTSLLYLIFRVIPTLYDSIIVWTMAIPIVYYFLVCYRKIPLWREGITEEKFLGFSNIHWYSMRKGGIGFPRIRFRDNRIFLVCFVDIEGTPVSQTLCVRIHKSLAMFWKDTQVTLISDNLWKKDKDGKTPWEKAEKFVIFNNGEIVGEGIIR